MAPPPTQIILKQEATLFKVGDPPIYVLPDGRFAACHNSNWVVRKTLASLEKEIRKDHVKIKLFRTYDSRNNWQRTTTIIEAIDCTSSQFIASDGKKFLIRDRWYIHTVEIVNALNDLAKRWDETDSLFTKEYDAIMKKATRVRDDSNFKDLLRWPKKGRVTNTEEDDDKTS